MKFILLLFIISTNIAVAQDSTSCKCCTPKHQQFDFWIGDWEVSDTSGNIVGKNNIVQLQNNCALQENWSSTAMTGTSYNYYNQKDSSWNQVWIDNQGGSLILKGGIINGAMVMKSDLIAGTKVDFYYNQITWTQLGNGTVSQQWDIFDSQNNLLTTLFLGIYKRKEE